MQTTDLRRSLKPADWVTFDTESAHEFPPRPALQNAIAPKRAVQVRRAGMDPMRLGASLGLRPLRTMSGKLATGLDLLPGPSELARTGRRWGLIAAETLRLPVLSEQQSFVRFRSAMEHGFRNPDDLAWDVRTAAHYAGHAGQEAFGCWLGLVNKTAALQDPAALVLCAGLFLDKATELEPTQRLVVGRQAMTLLRPFALAAPDSPALMPLARVVLANTALESRSTAPRPHYTHPWHSLAALLAWPEIVMPETGVQRRAAQALLTRLATLPTPLASEIDTAFLHATLRKRRDGLDTGKQPGTDPGWHRPGRADAESAGTSFTSFGTSRVSLPAVPAAGG